MYRRALTTLAFVAALLVFVAPSQAEVRLPHIFGSHMVLQREIEVPIWGWAEPGEEVTVTLDEQEVTATADDDGKWQVELSPMEAGGPYTLTVKGSNEISLEDVMFGEVWVCSGQSNMQWVVAQSADAGNEIANGEHPKLRMITVPTVTAGVPQEDFNGAWQVSTPQTVGGFSAVAYFFGLNLHRELHVPVGLIATSWGGSRIEPWTPDFAFSQQESLASIANDVENAQASYQEQVSALLDAIEGDEATQQLVAEAREALAENRPLPAIPGFSPPNHPLNGYPIPTSMYNAMINPVVPYAIRGAIWYQGESNNGEGMLYRDKMQALIEGWREVWDQGDFPFYFVQLAPFGGYNDGALEGIWEAQVASLGIPHTGMAVTTDIVHNLADIHPINKQDVGHRLALWALANDYGYDDLVYSGPIFKNATIDGDKIRIEFDHVGGGLASRDGGPLNWFQIGDGERFVDATAEIDGDTIVVSSPEFSEPLAVRFAWNRTAVANLINAEGLPASPFRTDCERPQIDGNRLFVDAKEVEIHSRAGEGEIRYTLDGSLPTQESPLYTGPIELKDTATVKARFFDAMGRSSLTSSATFERFEPLVYDGKTLLPGVGYRYYEGNWSNLPDFASLDMQHEGDLEAITLEARQREDQFGIVFDGYLRITEEGDYTFFLTSDDGSRISVDGNVLATVDGIHPPMSQASQPYHLTEGIHPVEIEYFENAGGQELTVEFEGPGVQRMDLSEALLSEQ